MAATVHPNPMEGPLFNGWDALDKIFDKAFAPRLTSSPLPTVPDFPSIDELLEKRAHNPSPGAHAMPVAMPMPVPSQPPPRYGSNNPYAIYHPAGSGPARYASASDGDSPLFSSSEEQEKEKRQHALAESEKDKMWEEAQRQIAEQLNSHLVNNRSGSVPTSNSNSNSTTNSNSIVKKSEPVRLKRKRSRLNYRESTDGKTVTAVFDLPGIAKEDIHVSFQPDRLIVTWEYVRVTETIEDGQTVRERKEKKYIRTVMIPEGTTFEEIHASMDGRRLSISWPKARPSQPVTIREV